MSNTTNADDKILQPGRLPFPLKPVTVVTGHYGSGKTSFSLNLAFDAAAQGLHPTLADLDVVNPYFRSSDLTGDLEEAGVRVIAPVFAGTSLDTPSLSPAIPSAITQATEEAPLIIDAGGDDAGAMVLGQYAALINARPHDSLYVVNRYRDFAEDMDEYIRVAAEIVGGSHVKLTGIVNNSHLMQETTAALIAEAVPFVEEIARRSEIPLVCTTVPKNRPGIVEEPGVAVPEVLSAIRGLGAKGADGMAEAGAIYPMTVYLHTPWEV